MKLTKNFNREEFDCKDGTPVPKIYYDNVLEVAENLEVLRTAIGEAVYISGSGYRTEKWNKKKGGAKFSQHLTASGADITAKNLSPKELAEKIEELIAEGKMKQGGLGVYPGFVHYDIRGTHARW